MSEQSGAEPTPVVRDEETLGLIGEFLVESEEGLSQADEILMLAEAEGADADSVDALFRVFHTIKGVAGFLELTEIADLAHTTETMLDQVRKGSRSLGGPILDLTLEASGFLRKMLTSVKTAVEQGVEFSETPGLPNLVSRVQCATRGDAPEASPTPAPEKPGAPEPRAEEPAPPSPSPPDDAAPRGPSGRAARLRETLKVDVERVDSLVDMIGELVILESMLRHAPETTQIPSSKYRGYLGQLDTITRDLQDLGMRMRMVPVRTTFQKMARLVRDLSRKSGKPVRLQMSGENTEMDRSMVEQIADPLVHMIRNAVDHGVESPEERERAGKPPMGIIRLSAYHESGHIVIEVGDDGGGLDRKAILRKAVERGIVSRPEDMADTEIFALIFAPGFSTAEQVTAVSGRGVGMDVVRRNIEQLRGRITIDSRLNEGTTFKITLPLTLAIIDGTLVRCGTERYIIPTLGIVESIQPTPDMRFVLTERHEMLQVREETIPLLRLADLFHIRSAEAKEITDGLVVVLSAMNRTVGLLVDEVITQQQVVIKAVGSGVGMTRYVSGAAILSDGLVGLILNIEEVCNQGEAPFSPIAGFVEPQVAVPQGGDP